MELSDFARERGLPVEGDGELRPVTPALVTGRRGSVVALASGQLAEGLDGTVCHHIGDTGRKSTIVLTRVAAIAAYLPALVCRDREGLGGSPPPELPVERWTRVALESAGFNRRYTVMVLTGQDPGFIREVFSPALISWLENDPPSGFSFELNEGHLTVLLPGHIGDPEELDRLSRLAVEVRDRIRREAADEGGLDADLFDEGEELRDIERGLAAVSWESPPESVQAAIARFTQAAARRPIALACGLLGAVVALAISGSVMTVIFDPIEGAIAAVLAAPAGFSVGRHIAAARHRWGTASVSRLGLEAWARGYARSRGLELESRWHFHSDHRHLTLPGFADHVLAGTLPGTNLVGRFVMLADAPELRSLGREIAATADRPLAANAILVTADREPPMLGRDIDLPEDYRIQVVGREVLVWRPVKGNLLRTSSGSDRFCAHASELVQGALAGQARTTHETTGGSEIER